MPTVHPSNQFRQEVQATSSSNPVILIPEAVSDLCYNAFVAASGTGNKIQGTVSDYDAIQAGTAVWYDIEANVTDLTLGQVPRALADANGAPLSLTAIRAVYGDQNLTLVLVGRKSY